MSLLRILVHEEIKLLCKHVMFRGISKINSHHADNWKDKHADADWLAKAIWRRVSDERSRPKLGTAKRGSNRRRKVNCGSQILSLLISFPGVAFTFNECLVAFKQLSVLFFIPYSLWLLKGGYTITHDTEYVHATGLREERPQPYHLSSSKFGEHTGLLGCWCLRVIDQAPLI